MQLQMDIMETFVAKWVCSRSTKYVGNFLKRYFSVKAFIFAKYLDFTVKSRLYECKICRLSGSEFLSLCTF